MQAQAQTIASNRNSTVDQVSILKFSLHCYFKAEGIATIV